MPAAAVTLMSAPIAAASTADKAPDRIEPERQADQNPVANRRPRPTYVEIAERTEKSAVGTNQSNAVLATTARPNRAPHTATLRIAKPPICTMYQRSAPCWPRAG